jgi:hypothetical protein
MVAASSVSNPKEVTTADVKESILNSIWHRQNDKERCKFNVPQQKKHVEYFYPTEPRRCFLFSNLKRVCSFINEYSFSLVLYSQLIIIFIYAVMLLVCSIYIYIYLLDRDVKDWRLRGERVSKQLVGRAETLWFLFNLHHWTWSSNGWTKWQMFWVLSGGFEMFFWFHLWLPRCPKNLYKLKWSAWRLNLKSFMAWSITVIA